MREQTGQMGFLAALGGLRSVVADYAYIRAYMAFEQTEWGRAEVPHGCRDFAPAALDAFLGDRRLAHGVECQHRRAERRVAAARGAAPEGVA